MKTLITFTIGLIFTTLLLGQTKKENLSISHLTGDFYVYTTYQDYKGTLFPANGLYLTTDQGVVLIDSPWDTTQFQPLLDSIKIKHNKDVAFCIATHSHEDRTGGLEFYKQKGIKTFTTKQTDLLSKATNKKRAEFIMSKDTTFTLGQYTFQTYFAGPGHTSDNIVVWFEDAKILYGGCLIKSMEALNLGNLADANVQAWTSTIKNIQKKFGKPKHVIPGHQNWASTQSLAHTLKLIRQHEKNKTR